MRRPLAVLGVALAVLLVGGCGSRPAPVVVTTIGPDGAPADLDDEANVAIGGVSLIAPDQLSLPPVSPTPTANQLVVSNLVTETGQYSGDLARAMLSDPEDRDAVTTQLASAASGFDTVQVSLFKLAAQDSTALVEFVAAVRDALPRDTALALTVIASTDFGGYRERGIDVEALDAHVDRFVLQTYEPAEIDVLPDPIDDEDGLVEEIDYLAAQIDADRIDLGISPLAGISADVGLRLATEAGLHGLVVGVGTQPEASVVPS